MATATEHDDAYARQGPRGLGEAVVLGAIIAISIALTFRFGTGGS